MPEIEGPKKEPIFIRGGLLRAAIWLVFLALAVWLGGYVYQFFDWITPGHH